MKEIKDITEIVTNFEEAREYLGGKPNADFTVVKNRLSDNNLKLGDVAILVSELNPQHVKALIAYNRLCTIAQAWNKADGFEPDFGNTDQYKYFPWFEYSTDDAEFVYETTVHAFTHACANFGSRLCFKTRERAMQFGKQFIDLWNDELGIADKATDNPTAETENVLHGIELKPGYVLEFGDKECAVIFPLKKIGFPKKTKLAIMYLYDGWRSLENADLSKLSAIRGLTCDGCLTSGDVLWRKPKKQKFTKAEISEKLGIPESDFEIIENTKPEA